MAGIKVIIPPETEPVTVNDIKVQLNYDIEDDTPNDRISPLIPAAREWCEGFQNRAYMTQTLEMALDCWETKPIRLKRAPLQTFTSISYTDYLGNVIVWNASNYLVNDYKEPAQIVKKAASTFPSVQLAEVNGIKLQYIAGYANAESVPTKIKQAITMLVMHWFENGVCEPPDAVKSLLWMDRIVPV